MIDDSSSAKIWFVICAVVAGIIGVLWVCATPTSAAVDKGALDEYVTGEMQKHGLPGVALAVTQDDQIVYEKGYGTAGEGRALTPQTPMYIGSTSKSFTALAVAQLAQDGKIDLDAPVVQYIPWFKVADSEASSTITIRHLLHHASGLSDAGYGMVLPENTSIEDAVRSLAQAHLTAPVGTQAQYFNHNYTVLSLVVQMVSGQPYADYLQQHILNPLEMKQTYTSEQAARADGLAQGYTRFFGFAIPARQPHPDYGLGNGYLISTAEDMGRYMIAMNNRGAFHGTQVLSPEWVSILQTPRQQQGFQYAMGWFVDWVDGVYRIHHDGANEAFRSLLKTYPARKLGVVVLVNQGYYLDANISTMELIGGVEQILLGHAAPPTSSGIAVPVIGYGILALTLGLLIFHARNIWRLRTWRQRASKMSVSRRAFDIAVSFIIPTGILAIVTWQLAGYFGNRFSLAQQTSLLFVVVPDMGVLLLVSSVPDYFQGIVKLWWALRGV